MGTRPLPNPTVVASFNPFLTNIKFRASSLATLNFIKSLITIFIGILIAASIVTILILYNLIGALFIGLLLLIVTLFGRYLSLSINNN
jgi:hypothetical protein